MQIKVNTECALKILVKHGFEVEGKLEEGAPLNAKKMLDVNEKVDLFQVYCGAPYVKFEATLDQETQRTILETLTRVLRPLFKARKPQP